MTETESPQPASSRRVPSSAGALDDRIDRRRAVRRLATMAGVAWVAPALQTINAARAAAATSSPAEVCFSAKFDLSCDEPNGVQDRPFQCLADAGRLEYAQGGCDLAEVNADPFLDGRWFVTLASGCRFVEGFSKAGNGCYPSPTPPGRTDAIEFLPRPKGDGHGSYAISNVQLTFCCPETRLPPRAHP